MQQQGSLTSGELKKLLLQCASDRATGLLTVRTGTKSCSLYFLFGHLFHAVTGDVKGAQAVLEAVAWPQADYDFDPKSQLIAEETITTPVDRLLSAPWGGWGRSPRGCLAAQFRRSYGAVS